MRTCPTCNTTNPDAVGACLTCGASLKGAARTPARMDAPQARTMAGLRPVSTTVEVPVVSPAELSFGALEEPAGASFDDQSWDVEALFGEVAAKEVRSLEAEVGISGATEALRRPARAEEAPARPESRPGRVPTAPAEDAGPPRGDRKTLGPWNFQGGLAALAHQINADQREAEDNAKTQGPWAAERAAAALSRRPAQTEPLPSGRALLQGIQDGEATPEPPQRASRKTVMGLPTARVSDEKAPATAASPPQRRGTLLGSPSPFDAQGGLRAKADADGEGGLSRTGKGSFFPGGTEPEHPAVIARAPAKPYATGEIDVPQSGLFKIPGKSLKKRKKPGEEDAPPPPRPSRSVGQYVMRGDLVAEPSHEAPREPREPRAALVTSEEEVAAARARPVEPQPGAMKTLNLASAPGAALLGPDPNTTLKNAIPAVTAPLPFPMADDFDGDPFAEEPEADPLDMDEFEISAFSGGGYHPDQVDLDGGITDLGPALTAQSPEGAFGRTVETDISLLQESQSEDWPGASEVAMGETYPMGVDVQEALSRARPVRREPTMEADRPDRRPTVQDPSPLFGEVASSQDSPSADDPWPAPPARSGPATELTPGPPSAGPATDIISPSPERPRASGAVRAAPVAAPPAAAGQGILRAAGALAGLAMLGGAGALLAQLGLEAALALDEVSLLALAFPLLGGLVAVLGAALPLPAVMRAAIIALVGAISVMLLSVAEVAPVALVGDPTRRLLMALCLALPMALIWRARGQGSFASRVALLLGVALVALNYALLGIGPTPTGSGLEAALAELQSGEVSRVLLGGLGLLPLALLLPALTGLLGGRARLAGVWAGGLLGWLLVFCAALGVISAGPAQAPALLGWVGLGGLVFGAALAVCAGLAEALVRFIHGDQISA